jgi:hypothetical protein
VRGGVPEARDLLLLRDQVKDRVEHQIDHRELALHAGCREVTDGHVDCLASRLGAQPTHRRFRVVDAYDRDAAAGERKRDPARTDPELQRPALFGEVCEELDHRLHRRRIEHLGGALVVDRRGALAEEAVRDRRRLLTRAEFARRRSVVSER